ncbi:hypothetical protein Leucomu_05890 [Leucobacter muris]|uniref:Uncharacterized protein n=1 Tax=Leucobacter muris TaxID=1935379 RepID=A0ABX5QEQ8_9MICO|nr:hypothetical protein [Leucobacter muris]QAB17515.1 hypothetical protein Leucomu_05890 [Leucobacter muris]
MALDGDMPRSRSTDPTTSVDAGRSVQVVHSRDYVLQTLRVFGPMADHELVAFHEVDAQGRYTFGIFSPQRLRSARAELVSLGHVESIENLFRKTSSGRRAHVWRAVPREE